MHSLLEFAYIVFSFALSAFSHFLIVSLGFVLLHSCLLGHCNKYDSHTVYIYQSTVQHLHTLSFSASI